MKRPVPRSSCREPKLDAAPTRCKSRKRTGNTRGAGARRSFGWQMLVGRITRLHRREVARPRGESRALSQKEARSTVRRGARVEKRRNGARRCTFPKSWRIFWSAGFGLQIRRHDRRHSRTFAHAAFTGNVKQSPKACRSIAVTSSARNMSRVAHRAVRRPTRACLQVTTECQRLDTIR